MDNSNPSKEKMDKIVKGLEEAYRKLVEYKRQINSPMVVFRDGKIVEADPHEMPSATTYQRCAD